MLAKVRQILIDHLIFIFIILFIAGCKPNPMDADVASENVTLTIKRFDSDLTSHANDLNFLKKKYGNFFYRYCNNLIPRMRGDNESAEAALKNFIADPDFLEVNRAVHDTFKNISETENQISEAFRYYKRYFPGRKIPEVITFNSLFNFAVISTDTVLGIGLDMYLGSNCRYYPSLGFPEYKIMHMRREYIPVDAMRGWFESEFPMDEGKHDFLSNLIYKGKILFALNAMLPKLNDTLKTGYSASQLEWCFENEKNIWAFFVDQKLLFSNSLEQYNKYTSEGPTTNGFPKESPGNIAAFTGWQIVQSYMKENPSLSLLQLMNENDAAIILKDSKYKPKK